MSGWHNGPGSVAYQRSEADGVALNIPVRACCPCDKRIGSEKDTKALCMELASKKDEMKYSFRTGMTLEDEERKKEKELENLRVNINKIEAEIAKVKEEKRAQEECAQSLTGQLKCLKRRLGENASCFQRTDECEHQIDVQMREAEQIAREVLAIESKSAKYGREEGQREELEELSRELEYYCDETEHIRNLGDQLYQASVNIVNTWRESPLLQHMLVAFSKHLKKCVNCDCHVCKNFEVQMKQLGQVDKKAAGRKIVKLLDDTHEKVKKIEMQIPCLFEQYHDFSKTCGRAN